MTPRRALAELLCIVALTVLPFLPLLDDLPWGADSVKWLDRGSLDHPRWAHWVFAERHFIGYRPVAALSFLLNHATTGYAAWGYRATDLALHALSAGMLFLLVAGLMRIREGRGTAWPLVAVLAYAAHPAIEEVVPFVARRSYLLAQVFGWGALALAVRLPALPSRRQPPASVAVAGLLGLALLSNEGAYVLLPLLPLCAMLAAPGPVTARAVALQVLPTAAVAVLALARRLQILGSLSGGYHKRYFAYLHGTVPAWREMSVPEPLGIADAAARYLLLPHPVVGGVGLLDGLRPAAGATAAALLLFLLLRPLWRPTHDARLGALAAVWMLGATVLVVASQTWFWRQAVFLLPGWGLWLAVWAREGTEALRSRRGLPAWPLAAAVLLALPSLSAGPLRGMHTEAHATRARYSPLAQQLVALGPSLPQGALVHVVAPAPSGPAHMIRLWGDRAARSRDLEHRLLAELAPKTDPDSVDPHVVAADRAPRLVLGEGMVWSHDAVQGVKLRRPGLTLRRLAGGDRPRVVVVLGPTAEVVLLDDHADTP